MKYFHPSTKNILTIKYPLPYVSVLLYLLKHVYYRYYGTNLMNSKCPFPEFACDFLNLVAVCWFLPNWNIHKKISVIDTVDPLPCDVSLCVRLKSIRLKLWQARNIIFLSKASCKFYFYMIKQLLHKHQCHVQIALFPFLSLISW